MKQILSEADRSLLEKRIKEAEAQTRTQIVLAVIKRSDNYAEIPWKAFAMGASAASLIVLLLDLLFPVWMTSIVILLSIAAILVAGALLALITVISPGIARLFLTRNRRQTEPLQYAESLFLSHELFTTDKRRGILLLISLFEHQVVVLPDTGVKTWLSEEVIKKIISGMAPELKKDNVTTAFEKGLAGLVRALCPPVLTETGKNELSDKIIEEEGV